MVTLKQKFIYRDDGTLDCESWLNKICQQHTLDNIDLIRHATLICQVWSQGLTTFYGQPCLEQGLEMAEILLDMKLDQAAVAAAIIASTAKQTNVSIETINKELGESVSKLIQGVLQMNALNDLHPSNRSRNKIQLDRLRKLFLSMVSDIRVVLIKLAERTCIMRSIKNINPNESKHIAQETMDIYAPLANRLGIGQLKWELEDSAFHYTHPEIYKTIAKFLAERRADREQRIQETISRLQTYLAKAGIAAEITGRAKHIYSIYLKTQRKHLDYKNIYDYSAVRILVPALDDCYTALSVAHNLFEHIPEEFDDYITHPKPNGYRSIHTAVIGPDGKHLEIQIRTKGMHEEAEHGVAAHWIYKENKAPQSGYEERITFLRQLLAWHKEVAAQDTTLDKQWDEIIEDTVYVLTPTGEIIDLPAGATPLDFAYHIHSEVGHRCRGAKIKGHIVPLTYALRTGDQVEIITTPKGTPSRDWLNKEFGYLKTSRARAKVSQWFKQQDLTQYVESGRHQLERELQRTGIPHPSFEKLAARFHYKDDEALFAAIGHGNLRIGQILHALQVETHDTEHKTPQLTQTIPPTPSGLQIAGINDLLTRIARCCKPIPGDKIIGYITQGRGVTIHRQDCSNIASYILHQSSRLITVAWDSKKISNYFVDLQVRAFGQQTILKEITALLHHAKINLVKLHSTINKKDNMIYILITVQIHDLAELNFLLTQVSQLPKVIEIKRMSAQ